MVTDIRDSLPAQIFLGLKKLARRVIRTLSLQEMLLNSDRHLRMYF